MSVIHSNLSNRLLIGERLVTLDVRVTHYPIMLRLSRGDFNGRNAYLISTNPKLCAYAHLVAEVIKKPKMPAGAGIKEIFIHSAM